jgi:ApaG protein
MILLIYLILLSLPSRLLSYRLMSTTSARFNRATELFMSTEKLDRKELWKSISQLERKAIELLSSAPSGSDSNSYDEAYRLLAQSSYLKKSDPFLQLAGSYSEALMSNNAAECDKLLVAMRLADVPPHIASLVTKKQTQISAPLPEYANGSEEEVDAGTTFSDTVTDKIRVKVNSFYDAEKSDPINGKYMFWYKVGIYNEGSEPVQIVARMWEIEKCSNEKEVVRGAGIMSTQPIIPPGDVFTYQSVCPLKVYPPKGKRILGSMSGAYTMCKGNMGQHNFTVKVGKFNLILPESVSTQ